METYSLPSRPSPTHTGATEPEGFLRALSTDISLDTRNTADILNSGSHAYLGKKTQGAQLVW